ncbi:BRO-N domain-containing protein [Alcaligenes sp. SDU_A2]|uniref:BRO-N domain-containing protein n=1 Tax=Alcaligenes sp. SDU_A2 TaxID=3136634 RepID=UPI00311E146A
MSKSTQGALAPTATSPSVFNFGAHSVRIVMRDGEPWFVAADVCKALAISNPTMALRALDDDEQALSSIEGLSRGSDQGNIISEAGMYTLMLRCRNAVKPGSVPHRFRKWVTSEVLPSIRTKGGYVSNPRVPQQSEILVAQAYARAAEAADIVSRHVFQAVLNGQVDPYQGRWLLETRYAGPKRELVPSMRMVADDALVVSVEEMIDALEDGLLAHFGMADLARMNTVCSSALMNRVQSGLRAQELKNRMAARKVPKTALATADVGSKN